MFTHYLECELGYTRDFRSLIRSPIIFCYGTCWLLKECTPHSSLHTLILMLFHKLNIVLWLDISRNIPLQIFLIFLKILITVKSSCENNFHCKFHTAKIGVDFKQWNWLQVRLSYILLIKIKRRLCVFKILTDSQYRSPVCSY